MNIDPFTTPGLLPAERLLMAALQAEPDASAARLETLTGMEPRTITIGLQQLHKRKLVPGKQRAGEKA